MGEIIFIEKNKESGAFAVGQCMDAQGLVRVDSKVTDNTVVDARTLEFA